MECSAHIAPISNVEFHLRTALLAAVKRTNTGELRAGLPLGGRSVLAWQIDLARELGCERIICLIERASEEVLAMQQRVEQSGRDFHAIRSTLQLTSLVRADDELVMMLDGLVVDRAVALNWARDGETLRKGIATFPKGNGHAGAYPEDFERIDRDRLWAGLAMMRASQVHKLADLPPDGDPMSLLLRLALQARADCREIGKEALEQHDWMLATTTSAIAEREAALAKSGEADLLWSGPARALAGVATRRLPTKWLQKGPEIVAAGSGILLTLGVGITGFGFVAAGLGVAAVGSMTAMLGQTWGEVRARIWSQESRARWPGILDLSSDIVAAIALTLAFVLQSSSLPGLALPLLAMGIAYLAGKTGPDVGRAFWRDRPIHLAAFSVTAVTGFLGEAVALFALAGLVHLMLRKPI